MSVRTNLEDVTAKEKDNRWLQLPICPRLLTNPEGSCSSENCEDYAHPPKRVLLKNKLKNGFVVCCHDYVFRHSGKGGCSKREECIYYHPTSSRQEMMVKIAGKVNKDIKALYVQRLAAEQQRLLLQQQHQIPPPLNPYAYTDASALHYLTAAYGRAYDPNKEEPEESNSRKRIRLDNNEPLNPSQILLQQQHHQQPSLSPLSVLPVTSQPLGLLPVSPYFGLNYGMFANYYQSHS